ncbi:ankyrin repeat domain-containing protein [Legionella cincinnatiensis]|uniref:Ankyrin repeat protein n=1 Tax=Legionella cincinnatiensis TaxID=28085 RepID=A0A378IR38_9GAMM|nr:ankyrin repeat domain-containing protein [Legionella cincinnatiensis]KTC83586.1 Ankyrin repeat protein [Legionella cincinnatiensis]STX34454.1 Ankyrin repeat protein [Legionella cincinnatiensis]
MFFKNNDEIIVQLLDAISKIDKTEVHAILQEAFMKKIDLNIYTNKFVTPLHWAILKCRVDTQDDMLEIIEQLYQTEIDLNKPSNDSKQYSPLHTAARRGLPLVVDWLLEHGADPMVKDTANKIPIHYVWSALNTKISNKNDLHVEKNQELIDRLIKVNELLNNCNTTTACFIL